MKKNKTLPKIIVILGPTASGKSEMAVKIAKKFRGEIISADSRQIYKGIDVGTAKIAKKEMKGIPHHLLDVVSPDKILTLAQYQKQTLAAIKKILKKGKLPIICGGTGLYIQAMVDNLRIPEVPPNPKIRAKIEKEIARNGLAAIYKKLLKLDPECEKFIDPKNPRRIIRALEVCLITKKPFSELRQKNKPLFKVLQIGLKIPMEKLRERINKRADGQIKAGLLKEVRRLAKKYPWTLPSMSGLGYKEFKNYLDDKEDLKTAIETLKKNTRQYAKRQMTWFRKDKRIKWIKTEKEAEKLIKTFLKQ